MNKNLKIAHDDNGIDTMLSIEKRILTFRGTQVMADRDLAELYGVETKRLNEQVKRNIERFPESFRFQLNDNERGELVASCDRFRMIKHSSVNPYVFTEQGVAMLSTVLRSEIAIKVSIRIMEAFVAMRNFMTANAHLFQRMEYLEVKQLSVESKLEEVLTRLGRFETPIEGVFFDGQIFDAYKFVCSLVKSAKSKIILIDNYIDETVLTLLDKRKDGVKAVIFTNNISNQLKLDVSRHNSQYASVEVRKVRNIHDRFIIVDDELYHIGASFKDLGKKLFAFSKMSMSPAEILEKLRLI